MKRLFIIGLAVFLSTCATSQQAPPDPPPPPPPAPQQTGTFSIGPITLDVPSPIRIDTAAAGGGSSVSLSATVLAALVTAIFGFGTGWLTRRQTRELAEMERRHAKELAESEQRHTRSLAEQEQAVRLEIANKELDAKDAELKNRADMANLEYEIKKNHFDREQEAIRERENLTRTASKEAEASKAAFENNRFALELRRLGVSDQEAYMAASRLEHDRKMAEVKLIQSFSDHLLGTAEKQLFALLVLSTYIEPKVIKNLAAAGEDIVTTATLQKLSTVDGPEIVSVVESILERRKSTATNEANPPTPLNEKKSPSATTEENSPPPSNDRADSVTSPQ